MPGSQCAQALSLSLSLPLTHTHTHTRTCIYKRHGMLTDNLLSLQNKMSTESRRIAFCQVFENYPLKNFDTFSETDIQTITRCIKIFKDPDSLKDNTFNFLEIKDLHLITHFFAVYGDDIRKTEFYDCEKLDGTRCICFLKQISEKNAHLIIKVLKLVQVPTCAHCPNNNFTTHIQKLLSHLPKCPI